jgi:hypothetical protein
MSLNNSNEEGVTHRSEWILDLGDGTHIEGVTKVDGVLVAEELVDVRWASTRSEPTMGRDRGSW